jgi:LuxR family maltose regulon positive regulatory protein
MHRLYASNLQQRTRDGIAQAMAKFSKLFLVRRTFERSSFSGSSLMTSTASDNASEYPELVLNTMPPRMSRYQLPRPRLSLKEERFRDYPIIVMQAPTGFGKTSLLGQWRREYLARGGAVAWMTADDSGNARRFLHGLVLAVRTGCARPAAPFAW